MLQCGLAEDCPKNCYGCNHLTGVRVYEVNALVSF
jgi:hypothetical protein